MRRAASHTAVPAVVASQHAGSLRVVAVASQLPEVPGSLVVVAVVPQLVLQGVPGSSASCSGQVWASALAQFAHGAQRTVSEMEAEAPPF